MFTRELLNGLALFLDATTPGQYDPTGITTGGTIITIKAVPASPDRVIALTAYPLTTDLEGGSELGLQVRVRGTTHPLDVDDLGDQVITALHGLSNVQFATGPRLSLITLTSQASMGADANGRWENSLNFRVITAR